MKPTPSSRTDASADSKDPTVPWRDFGRVLDQMVELLGGRPEDGDDGDDAASRMTTRRVPVVERGPQ